MRVSKIFLFMLLLNVILIGLRLTIGEPQYFKGNILSAGLFFVLTLSLLYLLLTRRYDTFILLWISFYFACPIIIIPGVEIGSLGLLNGLFIPLMILYSFNFRNKYFILICLMFLVALFGVTSIPLRLILSSILYYTAPFVFFFFVYRRCKDPEKILYGSLMITGINLVLPYLQFVLQPAWGGTFDWRGYRVMGNLFHPNDYAMYLFPPILYAYYRMREHMTLTRVIVLCLLFVAFLMTLSRIAVLGFIVAVVIMELFHRNLFTLTTIKVFVMILVTIGALGLLALDFSDRHLQTDTISERTVIWESVLPYVMDHLFFGNGVGSYEVNRDEIFKGLSPHNAYLEIVFELGILGLVLAITFLALILLDGFVRHRRKKLVHTSVAALVMYILVFSITDGAAFNQVVSLNAWISLAALLLITRRRT